MRVDSEFDGKVAVVTGGSTGIGQATVRRLVTGGASVVYCSDDAATLDAAQAALTADGLAATPVRADVSRDHDMHRLVETAIARHGGVDLLACCAGIQRYGTVVDTDPDEWDAVMGVNAKGCYLASRHAVPEMVRHGGGAVVLVSSVQAFVSQTRVAAYAASKGAVNALARAMSLDHAGDGIRVNVVCPGSVDTPMLRASAERFKGDGSAEDTLDAWARSHPLGRALGRLCAPAEVAELIAFLLSPRAAYISGAEYKVDGALLAGVAVALPE